MKKQKLFVLSMDAMVHEDVAYLMQKPNFSKIMAKRAEVERVCSVYPSITYPAHASIMTGCRPGKHGIYNNQPLKTYQDNIPHWYLYSKSIRVEDLFAAAKRAGCTTASVYWPITGRNPNIDYNIDEYFFYYYQFEQPLDALARLGANEATLEIVKKNMYRYPSFKSKGLAIDVTFDDFLTGCTSSLIREYQPDVMLVHNCYLDSARHRSGVFSDLVNEALDQTDVWLGEIVQAMEDAGVYEDTNFVILSDHGQMNYTRQAKLNVLLAQEGFLDVAPDGSIYDWRAYSQSCGFSSLIHLCDREDTALYQQVYALLKKLAADGSYGISEVFTEPEVRELYGQYGPFAFMVESDDTTYFSDDWHGEYFVPVAPDAPYLSKASHGYRPEKSAQPVFLAHGPAFREGAVLPTAQLIDEAPTLAKVLGQEMPQAEGRCLTELLR